MTVKDGDFEHYVQISQGPLWEIWCKIHHVRMLLGEISHEMLDIEIWLGNLGRLNEKPQEEKEENRKGKNNG